MTTDNKFVDFENFICVVSTPGSCGKFISTLLTYMANDLDPLPTPWENVFDHFHEQQTILKEKYTNAQRTQIPPKEIPYYQFFKKNIDYDIHTFAFDGGPWCPDVKELEKLFKDWKIVFISVEESDLLTVEANHYYKLGNIDYLNFYGIENKTKEQNKIIYEYTPDQVKPIIEHWVKNRNLDYLKTVLDSNVDFFITRIHSKYHNNLFKIKFKDIVYNKNTVISTMENVAGRPMSQSILEKYNLYVDRQLAHYKKRMPWALE